MTIPPIALPFVDPETVASLPPAPRRALFLDRDGVINVDHGYVHSRERTDWMPGIFETVAAATTAGLVCIVVTNQAGIARGYYDDAQFRRHTAWMHAEFRSRGVPLLATYYCPHHPDASPFACPCACRKPEPGMILAAAKDFDIDTAQSLMIGDKLSDIQAAEQSGIVNSLLVDAHDPTEILRWVGRYAEMRA